MELKAQITAILDKSKEMIKAETESGEVGPLVTEADIQHTRTLGARCAPYHLSKQLNISISKVMKCDNWHAWYMIIIQHKITAYSNNTSLIC